MVGLAVFGHCIGGVGTTCAGASSPFITLRRAFHGQLQRHHGDVLGRGSYAAISAALGCSNRDIAKTKTLIADLSITKESFAQLDPSFFDEHFSDHRGARRKRYDQPNFAKLAKRLANNKHLTRHELCAERG